MDGTLRQGGTPDRRQAVRLRRAELSWLRGLSLRPGPEVTLVDLSAGGALVETRTRLRPGFCTILRLTGAAGSWKVSVSVSRSWVAKVEPDHGVLYQAALVFDEALDIPGYLPVSAEPSRTGSAPPVAQPSDVRVTPDAAPLAPPEKRSPISSTDAIGSSMPPADPAYEDYYRFHRQPFSPTPDPEILYKSDSHQQALEQLLRGIRRREGILLLTGGVGTGKTTTTRALLRLLDKDVFTALVLNPFVSENELLRVLLQDFAFVSDGGDLQNAGRQSLVETLNRFLLWLGAVGATALAVVDEAQNLTPPVLEQLRVLTTLETDQQKLLQILIVGQPELQTLLASPEMRPLNQRIARRCTIRPLTCDEVEKYVGFRVRMAGGDWETMFTGRALDLIYQFTEGVPRKINLLCDRSLETGFAALSPTIDETLVAKAAEALEFTRASSAEVQPQQPQPADAKRRSWGSRWRVG